MELLSPVVPHWLQPKEQQEKGQPLKFRDQVSGANKYGPAENTQSQTKDGISTAVKATAPGYRKLVVDKVDIESDRNFGGNICYIRGRILPTRRPGGPGRSLWGRR